MKKINFILLGFLFICLSACSQNGNTNNGGAEDINDIKVGDVEGEFNFDIDAGGDRLRYVLREAGKTNKGQKIIEYTIQNSESDDVTPLHYGTSMKYDYYILDKNGKQVYRDSDEKKYTQALEKLELEPGEKKTYKLKLPELSSGEYILVLIPAADEFSDAEAELKFEIE